MLRKKIVFSLIFILLIASLALYWGSIGFRILSKLASILKPDEAQPTYPIQAATRQSKGISLTDTAPLQLALESDGESRNWEGIVRLDDLGFIIISDKFPKTILAFVQYP